MAKNFTENFINLSDWSLGSNRATELGFNHREDCLHIRPLVVVSQERLLVESVIVPHFLPESVKRFVALTSLRIVFEQDIRCPVDSLHSMKIFLAGISLISRDLLDGECLGGSIHQIGELGSIGCFSWGYFNASDNVGFDTAHQMSFHPLGFTPHLAPLVEGL